MKFEEGAFDYSDEEWNAIADTIDCDDEQDLWTWRVRLEERVGIWLGSRTRADYRVEIKSNDRIAAAAFELAVALESAGQDFVLGKESLKDLLAEIQHWYEEELNDDLKSDLKGGQIGRPSVQDMLCEFWHKELGRSVRRSWDPSRATASGPMVSFLIAAASPVMAKPLTGDQAVWAIRRYLPNSKPNGAGVSQK